MQQIIDKIQFVVGDIDVLQGIRQVPVRSVFDDRIVAFLNGLSRKLLSGGVNKQYPDIMSYAFWIRKSHLYKEKIRFESRPDKVGKGVAFHITPSNVPVNFAVSMTSAILAGNPCVMRLSNKEFAQVDIITKAMRELLDEEFQDLRGYFCLVRYEHSDEVSSYLSEICDIRIVWGGDDTIHTMRKYPLAPRASELTFSDRHSIAIINADEYLRQDAKEIANLFYTDTYYSDQNACSSPRMVVWMGRHIAEAKERFWESLRNKAQEEYELLPVVAIDKYEKFCELATSQYGEGVEKIPGDNLCLRIQVGSLTQELMSYKMYGGYFFEYSAKELEELVPILGKACQTIAYLGISSQDISDLVRRTGVRGVDRIVPIGHTMDLSFFWDGNDMIDVMSRYVISL